MSEDQLEQEAPRVTLEGMKDKIVNKTFHCPGGTTLTICVLEMQNGFTVTGESACVSPENFDLKIGMEIAEKDAIDKLWALEGYLLAEDIHRAGTECCDDECEDGDAVDIGFLLEDMRCMREQPSLSLVNMGPSGYVRVLESLVDRTLDKFGYA